MRTSVQAQCCVEAKGARAAQKDCPSCGLTARPVKASTVAAMTTRPLPKSTRFWVCRNSSCEVVYFDDLATRFAVLDLKVLPGFKLGGELICYCFGFTRGQIRRDPSLVDAIRSAVADRLCACGVRNPTGNCCLGEARGL